jgi:hypothetical protein
MAGVRDQIRYFLDFPAIQVKEMYDCSMLGEPFRNCKTDSASGSCDYGLSSVQSQAGQSLAPVLGSLRQPYHFVSCIA